jgi:hypothetical protein
MTQAICDQRNFRTLRVRDIKMMDRGFPLFWA